MKRAKNVNKIEVLRHPYQLTANFIKWKFTPGENRILIRTLQRIKVNQELGRNPQIDIDDQVTLRFHWRDLMLPNDNAIGRLKDDLERYRSKSIIIPDKMIIDGKEVEAERLTGLITEATWDKGKSYVDLKLNINWYHFLSNLAHGYTEYSSTVAYKLNTSYSIKMYYFVCHWFNNGGHKLTLEKFREEFDIDKNIYKTKTASAFKKRILKPSKELLDTLADRSFNFTEITQGRKIIGFSFKFYKTNNQNAQLVDWESVNAFLDKVNEDFKINNVQRARIAGLIKKYSFPMVKHFYRMQQHLIYDYVHSDMTVVDAIEKGLKTHNIEPIND